MSKGPPASGWFVAAEFAGYREADPHPFIPRMDYTENSSHHVGRGERLGEKVHVATVCGLDGRDVFRQLECVQGISDQLSYGSRTRHGGMEFILVIVLNIQRWRDDR